MKNWKATSLLTISSIALISVGLFYAFGLKVVKTSSEDISFSPSESYAEIATDQIKEKPKNIIIFVADGMGFSHLSLAMLSQQKEGVTSLWDQFDVRGWHDARCSYGPLTDSGASATAIATGTTTFFEVIGQDKDGKNQVNIFELASAQGYNTGIVTDSYIWDATPAAFAAHTKSRDNASDILNQYAASELDLIFGELEDVGEGEVPELEPTLEILKRRFQLLDKSLQLPQVANELKPIAAIYEEDEIQDFDSKPNLTQLTELAIKYLSSKDAPFILLVECEEMDSGSHRNDSKRIIKGIESLQKTLSSVLTFSKNNEETLLFFTSDHETGGLAVISENNYPDMQMVWATNHHTAAVVPLFATGPGAQYFSSVKRNRDIGKVLKNLIVHK